MAKEVFMPKAGMDMKEGVIIKWLANVGDEVKEGDGLLEIETDKVSMEVESPADGTLLCKYFEDGATVPVVTVIGYVGEKGEAVPDGPSTAGAEPTAEPKSPASTEKKEEKKAESSQYEYNVAVIGGGPAGYVAAIRAAQLGGKVILFEKDVVGGTCLNRGCIPTKTYLKTAEEIHTIKNASSRGIKLDTTGLTVNMEEVYAYKQQVVGKLTGGVAALLKSRKVTVVKGLAQLSGEHTVRCDGKTYEAESIILCGGSKAGRIPIPGVESEKVLTSDEILELKEVPKRLAVIGGGVIGTELATAFAGFGSEVTIIELTDHLVSMLDVEISQAVEKSIKKAGVKLMLGKQVEKIDGATVYLAGGETVEADYILLSIGRSAELECLGDLAEKITTERGKVVVDDKCRSSITNIYACGDVTTKSALAHSAFKMGETAAANAMGHDEKANLENVPSCLYTMPEAASVGMTEEAAKKKGDVKIGRFPFSANGRALASGEGDGFIKVIADAKFGEILGVHIVGPTATEMIAQAKILMEAEITIDEAAEIMFAHPTFSEAFGEACNDALGKCIHLP